MVQVQERFKYQRLLLKLSGEYFGSFGIEEPPLTQIVKQLLEAQSLGLKIAVVVGGGNWLRGNQLSFVQRSIADHMGMCATAINGLAISSEMLKQGGEATVMSAQRIIGCSEWDAALAKQLFDQGELLIFVGGTGNPFFSTDSAAALRAIQMEADLLLKATKYDGVFNLDPAQHSEAKKYNHLTFSEAISKNLKVMDLTAFDLCQQHALPIRVFEMTQKLPILDIARGKELGTFVGG